MRHRDPHEPLWLSRLRQSEAKRRREEPAQTGAEQRRRRDEAIRKLLNPGVPPHLAQPERLGRSTAEEIRLIEENERSRALGGPTT